MNLADDAELLQMMKDAGFTRVFLGIETPVEASLKEAQKLQNTRRSLLESVRRGQTYRMEVKAGALLALLLVADEVVVDDEHRAPPLALVELLELGHHLRG